MELRTKRDRLALCLCLALLLAAVLWLSWLFPLTGDDWYREELGQNIHSVGDLIHEVAIRWNRGNARVLGNVLAYSAACRPVYRALLRGGILYALMLVCWKLSGLKGWGGLRGVSAAVLALPRLMFREVYPWGAGFFNYVPPVLTVLAALYLMRGALEGREVPDGIGRCAALFWLGLCGQLFMETNTLYALLAGAALLILDWVRRKRPSLPIALFLMGAVTGAVFLFASPAYRRMDASGGSYQSALAGGLAVLLEKAEKNLPTVMEQMLTHCPLLYGGLTAAGLLHLGCGRGPVWLRAATGGVLTAGTVFFAAAQYTAFAPGLWLTLAVFLLFALAVVGMILLSSVKAVRVPVLFLVLSAGAAGGISHRAAVPVFALHVAAAGSAVADRRAGAPGPPAENSRIHRCGRGRRLLSGALRAHPRDGAAPLCHAGGGAGGGGQRGDGACPASRGLPLESGGAAGHGLLLRDPGRSHHPL